MPGDVRKHVRLAALMVALSAAYPLSGYAVGVAQVDFALGDVKALAPDGRSRPLAKGAEVVSGETIDTGSGRAQVRFTDGAQVSLSPQTQFRIDDYRFSGKADGSEKGFFSLVKGAMRTITGLVGRTNRDNYKVNTTVATIGIRGTEFSAALGSLCLLVHRGTVLVTAAGKTVAANPGEMVFVRDTNSRPRLVPAPEAGYQCDAPQRDSAAPEDVRTIVCTCSSLLATIPDAILASDAGTRAAAAAAAASAVIVDKIRRDDPKASP